MTKPSIVVSNTKDDIPVHLNDAIVNAWKEATRERSSFTIALSGGSLPKFLASLSDAFLARGEDPNFQSWHVFLADERCVPATDPDSNLGSLKQHFLSKVPIPENQIYGIDEEKLSSSATEVSEEYEIRLTTLLKEISGGKVDLAVLGFGPDGHTCSLFPGHALLEEKARWVAPIEDSPKPPPKRITLTLPVLNERTRHVIFCGAGSSKSPILQKTFATIGAGPEVEKGKKYSATLSAPPPFPCAMVVPNTDDDSNNTLTWIVDSDALQGVL